jgi:hypothetical protein
LQNVEYVTVKARKGGCLAYALEEHADNRDGNPANPPVYHPAIQGHRKGQNDAKERQAASQTILGKSVAALFRPHSYRVVSPVPTNETTYEVASARRDVKKP